MKHPYDRLDHIATPRDGIASCATQDKYARHHHDQMALKARLYPTLGFRLPWSSETKPVPLVLGGKWIVFCECGDAPMASPEWNEARCFTCGAIYTGLEWPRDRQGIEDLLIDRPVALVRAWLPGETTDDLRAQNTERGITEKVRTR